MNYHMKSSAPILLSMVLIACSTAKTPTLAPSPMVDPPVGEDVDLASLPSDQTVTRAGMAKFLLQAKYGEEYDPLPAVGGLFSDVNDHWAEPWIEQLNVEGISSGFSDGSFRPDNLVTRAEAAVFLLKAKNGAGYFPPPAAAGAFPDISGHWAEDWIEQLKAQGVSSGYSDGTFRPDAPLSAGNLRALLDAAFP